LHDRLLKEGEIPDPDPTLTMGLPADLLRRRPDIRAAERRLAAQTATIGVRTADLYPSFSLTGLLAIQSTSLDSLFGGSSGTWSLIPGLRWNIFSGGKIRNQIRVEEARTEQALLLWEKTVLLALEEVEDALVAYQREKVRRQRLREGVEASSKAVELVRTQYMAGLTDFVSYLDSQRALFRQQDQLAESEGEVVQNLIQLNRALGGGWASEMAGPSYVTWTGATPPPESLIEAAVTPTK
jgi:NodT family efflux transporter outer membrane factor (OMF) lipoprotein